MTHELAHAVKETIMQYRQITSLFALCKRFQADDAINQTVTTLLPSNMAYFFDMEIQNMVNYG